MSAKHTPGPWRIEDDNGSLRILAPDARTTIICEGVGPSSNQSAQADARLIAAAPCLFNAAIDGEGELRAAAAIMETQGHRKTAERFMHYAVNLRKATAKATGEGEA